MKNRVGLGTFPLASVFTKVTKKRAEEMVKTFIDKGGYYIDAAPVYGFGEVERILGKALKSFPRNQYYLMTKCGWVGIGSQKPAVSSKKKDILRECEDSLRRLGVNCIDLYFVHLPDPDTPFRETMEALLDLKKDGKIRRIGVSNVSLRELEEYARHGKVEFVQNRFSCVNRSIGSHFSKYLERKKIGLVPYQVVERGLLTGKVSGKYRLRPGDLRRQKPEWQAEVATEISDWTNTCLRPIAESLGVDTENLAISWMLSKPYVDFVIVGATNIEQVETNLESGDLRLPKKIIREIDESYENFELDIRRRYKKEVYRFMGLDDKFYQPSLDPRQA